RVGSAGAAGIASMVPPRMGWLASGLADRFVYRAAGDLRRNQSRGLEYFARRRPGQRHASGEGTFVGMEHNLECTQHGGERARAGGEAVGLSLLGHRSRDCRLLLYPVRWTGHGRLPICPRAAKKLYMNTLRQVGLLSVIALCGLSPDLMPGWA